MPKKNEFTLLNEGHGELKREKIVLLNEAKNSSHYHLIKALMPNYNAIDKLQTWHNAKQGTRGIKGGVGSGKTHTMCADDIAVSYLNAPYYHLNTSPSFDNAKATVLIEYMKICDANNLTYDWIESKNEFIIAHADNRISTIKIVGADMPKFIKGINAASGSMNEPFSQKKESFTVWWERIRIKAAVKLSRVWGGTAEPEKMQWGFEFYDQEIIDKPRLYATTVSTYDNAHNLAPDYIPNLEEKYDAKMREVYMHGKYVNLSHGSAYNFDRSKNIMPINDALNKLHAMPMKTIVLGFDFNINPMTCAEKFLDGERDIQIDEYKISSSNTRELAQVVRQRITRRYNLLNTDVQNSRSVSFIVTGDGSGLKGDTRSQDRYYNDYSIIKEELEKIPGIQLSFVLPENGQNPHVHDCVQFMNNRFEKQLSWICDNCEHTINDFCLVTWKEGAEKFHLNKANKDQTHLSDASRYATWWVQPLLIDESKKKPVIQVVYSDRWN